MAQYSQCKRRISLFIAKLESEPTATAEKTQREIDDLKDTLATLKRQNNMLRQRHSKMPNSGRLHKQVTQLTQLLDRVKTTSAITAIERRKQRLSTTY